MKYGRISKFLAKIGNKQLNKTSDSAIEEIVGQYQNIDRDYLKFISEIGVGNIDDRLNIIGCLFDFRDIGLEDVYDIPESVKFFADNFAGDFIGFDLLKKDEVIEFWHDSEEIFYTGKKFYEYINDLIIN